MITKGDAESEGDDRMKVWAKEQSFIFSILLLIAVLGFVWCVIQQVNASAEADTRRLTWFPYHAPVLMDVTTGDYGELTVYDNDRYKVGLLSEEQHGGFMAMTRPAGAYAVRDADAHTCRVTLPDESVEAGSSRRYVLVDTQNPDDVRVYPITNGAVYEIRDYTVNVSLDDQGKLNVYVTGNLDLPSGESERVSNGSQF